MKALVARVTVFLFVGLSMMVHFMGSRLRGKRERTDSRPCRVFLIGAFDSAGWIKAHAGPLVRCRTVDEVHVICDEPLELEMEGVRFCCPTSDLSRWLGRGFARIAVLLRESWKLRPAVYMGYHIMPNAPLALLAAGLFGGKAIYQMTGGPIQVLDGGVESENPLLRATRTPSDLQESLLCAMVRRFDLVIVRGAKAREFIINRVEMKRCAVLTGAIDTSRFAPDESGMRDIDLVLVSRLVASFKGVERFIDVVGSLSALRPKVHAAIIGDGPARDELMDRAADLGVAANIEFAGRCQDVRGFLNRSKVFVLLSPSEGMSIAMLEAMSCGLPVIVTDVGELGDALRGENGGYLVEYQNAEEVAQLLEDLLRNEEKRSRMASNARMRIVDSYSVEAVAELWDRLLACDAQADDQSSRSNEVLRRNPADDGNCLVARETR